MPVGEESPLKRGHQIGVPPLEIVILPLLAHLAWKRLQIDADVLLDHVAKLHGNRSTAKMEKKKERKEKNKTSALKHKGLRRSYRSSSGGLNKTYLFDWFFDRANRLSRGSATYRQLFSPTDCDTSAGCNKKRSEADPVDTRQRVNE